jgi:hypothetical protein
MLFGETVVVYCENHTQHTYSPYLAGNTLRLRYRAQQVNALLGNSHCLLKLKLIYDRQSVGQSVLVSGAHLGPVTTFSFSLKLPLDSCGFVIL